LEHGHRRDFKKSNTSIFSKTANIKGALPLPPALPRPHATNDEKKATPAVSGSSTDDKLSALHSYRRLVGYASGVETNGTQDTN
jgi:hypothetical protein